MEQKPPKLTRHIKKESDSIRGWEDIMNSSDLESRLYLIKSVAQEQGIDLERAQMLELGSGNAEFLDYARAQGCNMVGVDVNPRGGNESPQVRARIEQLPFEDEKFDLAFSSYIFDHKVYNQQASAMGREIHRVLKPGGLYVTSEPHLPVGLLQGFEIKGYGNPNDIGRPIILKKILH